MDTQRLIRTARLQLLEALEQLNLMTGAASLSSPDFVAATNKLVLIINKISLLLDLMGEDDTIEVKKEEPS